MNRRIILGHGASGSAASMAPWVEALGRHGVEAVAIDLPRSAAGAVPVFLAAAGDDGTAVLGGHSFGGRVASLAAEKVLAGGGSLGGLLLLSYPLHRPGQPRTWEERTDHWPRITCPVLLLSGESDPFARLPLLREVVTRFPDVRLVTFPRIGHGLLPVLDSAVESAVEFIRSLSP